MLLFYVAETGLELKNTSDPGRKRVIITVVTTTGNSTQPNLNESWQ